MVESSGQEETLAGTLAGDGPGARYAFDLEPGDVLAGRYEIVDKIGRGGMAYIYEALHRGIGKRVAVKILADPLVDRDDVVRRFVSEAKTMSKIGHRNVVDVFDFGQTDAGAPFFVMEYLEGRDLSALLRDEGPLDWSRLHPLLLQICAGLAAAHAQGVVHRDVKPSNCFVILDGDGNEEIKLLDFGIAKALDPTLDEAAPTLTGAMLGTAGYMAPEQAMGQAVDERTDVYSVGVLLFQLLTGQLPLRGAGTMATLSLHLFSAPPRLSEVGPHRFPRAVERLVAKAMAKLPKHRHSSISDLAAAIEKIGPNLPSNRTRSIGGVSLGVALILGGVGVALYADEAPPQVPGPTEVEAAHLEVEPEPRPVEATAAPEEPPPAPDRDEAIAVEQDVDEAAARQEAPEPATRRPRRTDSSTPRRRSEARKPSKTAPEPAKADPSAIRRALESRDYKSCRSQGGLPGMKVKLRVEVTRAGGFRTRTLAPVAGSPLAPCMESIANGAELDPPGAPWTGVLSIRL